MAGLNALRLQVITPLETLRKTAGDTVGQQVLALYAFLEAIQLPAALEARSEALLAQGEPELARQYGTPLYLMDEDRIRANCRVYTEAFRSTSAPRPAPVRQQGQLLPAHL